MDPITSETTLPAEALTPGTAITAARQEFWRHLPAWMFFVYGVLLLNTELTNFSPARGDLAHTVVFPLLVFVIYQVLRFTHGTGSRRMLITSLVLAFGLPPLIFFWHTPSPLSHDGLLRIYEWSNFAWAALLVWHLWKHQRSHVALFFGVGLLYGAVLENGGIILGFFHETNLTDTMVRPFVAPVATMIGWSVVLAMATFVTWGLRKRLPWLRRSALLSALAVGTFATLLDLQIDPIATAVGCWVWHETLPGWFHGVPLVNFIAWMCALVPFGYVMFRVQERRGLRDGAAWRPEDLLALLKWSPAGLVCAALSFISVTLLIEGVTGPSWTLLNVFTARVLAVVL
ncbi:MAG: carotenoid biosynthesis protein [Archangium sp.]|nr:carotenoid biosynthesis protein [Archangium sp.]